MRDDRPAKGSARAPRRHRPAFLGWCSGTVIAHDDGWRECTEPECPDLQDVRHIWTVECTTLWGACPCRESGQPEPHAL